jgi:uncharacterized protein YyaL (SSP411 family)
MREMSLAGGGFASSMDADSEGEEGRFYLWDKAEPQGLARVKREFAIVLPATTALRAVPTSRAPTGTFHVAEPLAGGLPKISASDEAEAEATSRQRPCTLFARRETRTRPATTSCWSAGMP